MSEPRPESKIIMWWHSLFSSLLWYHILGSFISVMLNICVFSGMLVYVRDFSLQFPAFIFSETLGYGHTSFGIVCLCAVTQHLLGVLKMTVCWSMGEFITGIRRNPVLCFLYFIILICWPVTIITKCHWTERPNTRFVKSTCNVWFKVCVCCKRGCVIGS